MVADANWTNREVTWTIKDIGAPLLDSLAGGLYSKLEVFREYVQNAVDSYVDFQKLTGRAPESVVQVWVDHFNRNLHVLDRGIGMDWNDIQTAKAIAVSPKLARPTEFAGFRGLGIWSGLAACERMILTTTKVGVPSAYRLTLLCADIVDHYQEPMSIDELLDGRFQLQETSWQPNEHFTSVKLEGIRVDRYAELVDSVAMTHYAEQNLPVPFDPSWPYTSRVLSFLKDVPHTSTFQLTIDGTPVYRRFPNAGDDAFSDGTDIKQPEFTSIEDEGGRQVGFAWWCETNRRGSVKALDWNPDRGVIRNFAVRVKNFTIGDRGLYSVSREVPDPSNLGWFVGEIYIVDTDIKPDTKRNNFQPSVRHDAAIKAVRRFYASVSPRARGWSAQVVAEERCKDARGRIADIEHKLDQIEVDDDAAMTAIREAWSELQGTEQGVKKDLDQATRADGRREAESARIVRRYLRKPDVKADLEGTLGLISALRRSLDERLPETTTQAGEDLPAPAKKSAVSKAMTATLGGTPVSTTEAVGTTATAGATVTAAPPIGTTVDQDNGDESTDSATREVNLDTALDAFYAAVAAVVGIQSESYRRILDRLPEELRRRGIDV